MAEGEGEGMLDIRPPACNLMGNPRGLFKTDLNAFVAEFFLFGAAGITGPSG